MSKPNAILALKPEDRPKGKQERIKAADVATYLTEEQIQVAVAAYLNAKLPKGWMWFHTPNGSHRLKSVAAKLKAAGVKPGVPDVQILRPTGSPIWIELKAFGGTLTVAQANFRNWCVENKHPHRVCRSVGEVEVFLKEFLA